jgi:hypothetical protein
MGGKRVTITLTEAQADALLSFAVEGECSMEDQVHDGLMPPATWQAGKRATDQLRRVCADLRGDR